MARKTVSNMYWDTEREREIDKILDPWPRNKPRLIQGDDEQNRINKTNPIKRSYNDHPR